MGNKSKYETHVEPKLDLIKGWARDGLSNDEIADNCGLARSTFYKYISIYSGLADALKESKDEADFKVENALYKRALGYSAEETTVETEETPDGQIYSRKVKVVKKHIPPDVGAMIFWLKNRQKQKWKNNPEQIDDSLAQAIEAPMLYKALEDDNT